MSDSTPAADCYSVDVAVVGGGPAGLAAASAAAERGAKTLLIDAGLALGGQIWRHVPGARVPGARAPGARVPRAARRAIRRLEQSGAAVLLESAVFDAVPPSSGDPAELRVERRGRLVRVAARHIVLATGARELFLPFPGWTLPGVLGVGGAQALLKSGASMRGERIVVAGSGPLLLPVAALLARHGARVARVVEQTSPEQLGRFAAGLWRAPSKIVQAATYRAAFARTPLAAGTWVARAEGEGRVEEAVLTDGTRTWTEPCDVLAVGYGLVPSTELARLLGCRVENGVVVGDDRQQTSVGDVFAAGEPTGVAGADAAEVEGEIAGLASVDAAIPAKLVRRRDAGRRFAERLSECFALRPELRDLPNGDTIVCRCEDVRWADLAELDSTRQAKLITRAGMGPCQGRVCGAALRVLRPEWGEDSVRPPLWPVPSRCLALDRFAGPREDAEHG